MTNNHDQTGRYLLTVLMCDLVGSTAAVTHSDPEEMFDWIAGYNTICCDAVRKYGGVVSRMTGDGVVAYFGYPRSVEKSGSAAIYSARQILKLLQERPLPRGRCAEIRIGIATGWAVIGELNVGLPGQEAFAVGDALNLASRLQQAAEPNQILIADETKELAKGPFRFSAIANLRLKGFDGVTTAWRVDFDADNQQQASEANDAAPFVGRQGELTTLLEQAKAAGGASGRVVEIVGEPGMGKTRLVREFQALAANGQVSPFVVLENEEHSRNVAFSCFLKHVRTELGGDPREKGGVSATAIAGWTTAQSGLVADDVAVMAAVLGGEAANFAPPVLQSKSRDLFSRWLGGLCRPPRVAVVVEDAQWLDPSSLSVLKDVAAGLSRHPGMLVFTARPEWAGAECKDAVRIELERLTDDSARELALWHLAAPDSAGAAEVVKKAEGVPLFVEELAKAAKLTRAAVSGTNAYHVPRPVQESILAQIDRLAPNRQLVQLAAAIGPEFSAPLVAAVVDRSCADVLDEFAPLIGGGIVEQTGPNEFRFRHLLVHAAVLASELPRQLVRFNKAIVQTLDRTDPGFLQSNPHVRAKYLFGAGENADAIQCLIDAALRRFAASQFEEAVGYLKEAEAKLQLVGDDKTRTGLDLRIQAYLGAAWIQLKNFAAPEVAAAYDRAQKLTQSLTSASEEQFAALWGVWSNRLVGGQVGKGVELCRSLVSISRAAGSRHLAVLANSAELVTATIAGTAPEVERHVAFLNEHFDPNSDVHDAIAYAIDAKALTLLYAGHASWMRGDFEYSSERIVEALRHVETSPYEFVRPYVMIFAAVLPLYVGPSPEARALIDGALAIADRFSIAYWQIIGRVWQSIAILRERLDVDALNLLDNLIHVYRGSGAAFYISYQAALSGLKLVEAGEVDRGLRNIALGLALAEEDTERFTLPEVYRMSALAYASLPKPNLDEAQRLLQRGFDLGKAQGASAWMLSSAAAAERLGLSIADGGGNLCSLAAVLSMVEARGMSRQHPVYLDALSFRDKSAAAR